MAQLKLIKGKQSVDEAIEAPVEELKREEAEKVAQGKRDLDDVIRRAVKRPRVALSEQAINALGVLRTGDMATYTEMKQKLSGLQGVSWEQIEAKLFGERRKIVDNADVMPQYPCPDVLWQGLFADLGTRLGSQSWESWIGLYAGLSAIASRQISAGYMTDSIMGMTYALLIKPTGSGKTEVTNTCREILPNSVECHSGVQSGAGLAPLLADIERDNKGKFIKAVPHPTILVMDEWTTLVKNAGINNSTLAEDVNGLFHRRHAWGQNKSERTGGRVTIPEPALSILGTTTPELLRVCMTAERIYNGFFGRYLILPGTQREWKFYDPDRKPLDYEAVKKRMSSFQAAVAWRASDDNELYAAKAFKSLNAWAEVHINPLMNQRGNISSLERAALGRLHVYLHQISLIYAWSENLREILPRHVEASIAVVDTAKQFTLWLMSQPEDLEAPYHKRYESAVDERVYKFVEVNPGSSMGQTIKRLKGGRRSSSAIREAIERLLKNNDLRIEGQNVPGGTSIKLWPAR